jgi:hypothetical protein
MKKVAAANSKHYGARSFGNGDVTSWKTKSMVLTPSRLLQKNELVIVTNGTA